MLLYIIESAVPLLTIFLIRAVWFAVKKDIDSHRKNAITHAIATFASYVIVITLVRMGYTMGGKAPEWLMSLHLVIIYMIPPMLVALLVLGLKGKRKAHIPVAVFYLIIWSGALVTGAMIFMAGRGLL